MYHYRDCPLRWLHSTYNYFQWMPRISKGVHTFFSRILTMYTQWMPLTACARIDSMHRWPCFNVHGHPWEDKNYTCDLLSVTQKTFVPDVTLHGAVMPYYMEQWGLVRCRGTLNRNIILRRTVHTTVCAFVHHLTPFHKSSRAFSFTSSAHKSTFCIPKHTVTPP